ncbi:MAG: uncharacterized protein A8A55_1793 [Amphiamblys sp. WSBS2006]|nr:MAG: uncharacterized protein A8A55_1793 [Amphiamblys sp. WSBS2006]
MEDLSQPENRKIDVEFLLYTNERKTHSYPMDTRMDEIKQSIYEKWPAEWSIQPPLTKEHIRFISRGHYIEPQSTLHDHMNTPTEKVCIHLLVFDKIQKEQKTKQKKRRFCFLC